ncbi:hypothetical protein UXQ11_02795 [Enterobacter hormaechei]|nr:MULTISPECIES: hypothetical protein [Enterobacter cloacae complex]ESM80457.1 hypothetical protein L384_03332 [Enterobacter sp. MGH 38]HAV1841730.1 hypothetical protein [Enterobacter hormaechei subsp. xiangfangensis]
MSGRVNGKSISNSFTKRFFVCLIKIALFLSGVFTVLLIPFGAFFIFVVLFLKMRLSQKATHLYHFSNGEDNFSNILKSRCLMSLTGGRCYATSRFNPNLGVSTVGDKNQKFFIVFRGEAVSFFKPIVSNCRDYFHIWKWWKSFRCEWVSRNLIDIGLPNSLTIHTRIKVSKGFFTRKKRIVYYNFVVVDSLEWLTEKNYILSLQKRVFWFFEWVLSFFIWFAAATLNYIFYCLVNKKELSAPMNDLILTIKNNCCISVTVVFFIAIIGCISHSKLKALAINTRKNIQHEKYKIKD